MAPPGTVSQRVEVVEEEMGSLRSSIQDLTGQVALLVGKMTEIATDNGRILASLGDSERESHPRGEGSESRPPGVQKFV